MPTYRLTAVVAVSAHTTVEADSLEEAIKISEGRPIVLGGLGFGGSENSDWLIDDADGEPQDISEE